jgi:[ribosomal protein S18]-alanine N-acetyltransferase
MDARPYDPTDLAACLALTRSPDQAEALARFLTHPPAGFFVLEHEQSVLACGGLANADGEDTAEIVWALVHPDWERRGVGRYLLLFLARQCQAPFLDVRVSPAFASFYERAGFRRVDGEGGRVHLRKKMEVCPP